MPDCYGNSYSERPTWMGNSLFVGQFDSFYWRNVLRFLCIRRVTGVEL